jgi:hypothetical protein
MARPQRQQRLRTWRGSRGERPWSKPTAERCPKPAGRRRRRGLQVSVAPQRCPGRRLTLGSRLPATRACAGGWAMCAKAAAGWGDPGFPLAAGEAAAGGSRLGDVRQGGWQLGRSAHAARSWATCAKAAAGWGGLRFRLAAGATCAKIVRLAAGATRVSAGGRGGRRRRLAAGRPAPRRLPAPATRTFVWWPGRPAPRSPGWRQCLCSGLR